MPPKPKPIIKPLSMEHITKSHFDPCSGAKWHIKQFDDIKSPREKLAVPPKTVRK